MCNIRNRFIFMLVLFLKYEYKICRSLIFLTVGSKVKNLTPHKAFYEQMNKRNIERRN